LRDRLLLMYVILLTILFFNLLLIKAIRLEISSFQFIKQTNSTRDFSNYIKYIKTSIGEKNICLYKDLNSYMCEIKFRADALKLAKLIMLCFERKIEILKLEVRNLTKRYKSVELILKYRDIKK